MKFLTIPLIPLLFLAGLVEGIYLYNREIPSIELKIIMAVCSKNEGIRTLRRSFFDHKAYVISCADGAVFDNVTFNMKEVGSDYTNLVSRGM